MDASYFRTSHTGTVDQICQHVTEVQLRSPLTRRNQHRSEFSVSRWKGTLTDGKTVLHCDPTDKDPIRHFNIHHAAVEPIQELFPLSIFYMSLY